MILNKELEEMLKVYIDNNLQELKTKFDNIEKQILWNAKVLE